MVEESPPMGLDMPHTGLILTQARPPTDCETFVGLIQAEYDGLSRSFQAVARYLTQNPNDVAMQSISDIAGKCGVHASSLVRFAQSFGYDGFKELKELFSRRLATAAPGFEARVKSPSRSDSSVCHAVAATRQL